jgi:ribosomal protein L37AE/L43A
MAMRTKRFCPKCGSDEVMMVAGGTTGMWVCKSCGFSGPSFPEEPITELEQRESSIPEVSSDDLDDFKKINKKK